MKLSQFVVSELSKIERLTEPCPPPYLHAAPAPAVRPAVNIALYYMALSHKDLELPNS